MTERNNFQKLSLVCEKRLVFVLLTQKTAREIIHHEVPFQHYTSKLFQLHSKHIQLPVQPVQLPRGGSFARNFTLAGRMICSVSRCLFVRVGCLMHCVPFQNLITVQIFFWDICSVEGPSQSCLQALRLVKYLSAGEKLCAR